MDEAERLCDRVAVVDHGRVIAQGSPRELIASLGGEHILDFSLLNPDGDAALLFIQPCWTFLPYVAFAKRMGSILLLSQSRTSRCRRCSIGCGKRIASFPI